MKVNGREVTVVYTTAPRKYDWAQVIESEAVPYRDHRGRQFRRVTIAEDLMGGSASQLGRYGSGLHVSYTPEEFREEERRLSKYVEKDDSLEVPISEIDVAYRTSDGYFRLEIVQGETAFKVSKGKGDPHYRVEPAPRASKERADAPNAKVSYYRTLEDAILDIEAERRHEDVESGDFD